MKARHLSLLLPVVLAQPEWPRIGIHDGSNKIEWTTGCCDGDLIVVDFRDEQADGNAGHGLLTLANSSSGVAATYEITPFHGLWKAFGPFCAPAGTHTLSFTSDAQPVETTFSIIDSFGLVKGKGGMNDLPLTFNTSHPSRFCTDDNLGCDCDPDNWAPAISACSKNACYNSRNKERARKLFAYSLQFKSRSELASAGFEEDCPYDHGYTVVKPPP